MTDTVRGGRTAYLDHPVGLEPVDLGSATPADHTPGRLATPGGRSRRLLPVAGAGLAYLVLSVGMWWQVWSTHPTSVTTCGCGDSSLFTWFLEWPAYALAHGLDPLWSSAMFHPGGVNLLANTAEVGIGLVLAPVTWVFGPVATLNVALTLAPALSALAMFVAVRRWVAWWPAAFVAGLCYGFSPLIVASSTDAHLMVTMAAVPPLVLICLDELLARQTRSPVRVGIVLGLLLVVQFFLGTELLLITVMTAAVGVALVVGYTALRRPDVLRARAGHAVRGLAVGGGVAAALLAWPTWFALAGPAHLSGLVWPSLPPGLYGTRPSDLVRLNATAVATAQARRFGGYQGIAPHESAYLGVGLLGVWVAGTLLWRRDRRLWLFGSVGVVALACSLSVQIGGWVPWRLLRHVPVVANILPVRFAAMVWLSAAACLGVIVDHAHRAAAGWLARRSGARRPEGIGARAVAAVVAAAVALLALAPLVATERGRLPLTAAPVVLPQWFATVAPHLPPGQVVLAYPDSFGGFQSSLTWQAVDRMTYASVEGAGPTGDPTRLGPERAGAAALAADLGFDPATAYSPATVATVRATLFAWGVTRVVVPDQPGLPLYEQGFHTAYEVGLLTAALGRAPQFEARAWVWTPDRAVPAAVVAPAALRACAGATNRPSGPPERVPDCVLAAAGRGPTRKG